MARLNLNFTLQTAGWILYESGNRISSGQSDTEWWLRAAPWRGCGGSARNGGNSKESIC